MFHSFDLQSEPYKLFDMFKDRIPEKIKFGFFNILYMYNFNW